MQQIPFLPSIVCDVFLLARLHDAAPHPLNTNTNNEGEFKSDRAGY